MSVSTVSSSDRNYLDLIGGSNKTSDTTDKTSGANKAYNNAVFENEADTSIKFDDFFDLMLQQLTNQDFMNPVDDTEYLSQLAEISSMQAMQEIANYEKANNAMSYLGKAVVATTYNVGATATNDTGTVTQVMLKDGEYQLMVNGKNYKLSEIKTIYAGDAPKTDTNKDDTKKDTDESAKQA